MNCGFGLSQHHCVCFIVVNIKIAVNYSRTISVLHLIISVLHYYFLLAPLKCEHNACTAFSTRIERQMADFTIYSWSQFA